MKFLTNVRGNYLNKYGKYKIIDPIMFQNSKEFVPGGQFKDDVKQYQEMFETGFKRIINKYNYFYNPYVNDNN